MRVKPDRVEVGVGQRYRVNSWSGYHRALVNRDNLTLWFEEASIRQQWTALLPGGVGKPAACSKTLILTCLTIEELLPLPWWATEGLAKSLMRLAQLDLSVPAHTHLSRRAAQLSVNIARSPRRGPTYGVVDSTALKIFGEGQWAKAGSREALLPAAASGRLCTTDRGTVGQHGVRERCTWRKLRLAVGEAGKNIIGIEGTTAASGDSKVLPGPLGQVDRDVSQVSTDGACDSYGCHAATGERGARGTIQPRALGVRRTGAFPLRVVPFGGGRWAAASGTPFGDAGAAADNRRCIGRAPRMTTSGHDQTPPPGLDPVTSLRMPKSLPVGEAVPAPSSGAGKVGIHVDGRNLARLVY